jgi:hypothetical protein
MLRLLLNDLLEFGFGLIEPAELPQVRGDFYFEGDLSRVSGDSGPKVFKGCSPVAAAASLPRQV